MVKKTQTVRLLLIEDNEDDVQLFKHFLKKNSSYRFDFTNAACLHDGLEELKNHSYDIIVADLGLPDSVGIDTVSNVVKVCPRVPVVVMTGAYDPDLATEAIQAGAEDFVVKSVRNPELITRTLHNAIYRNKVKRDLYHAEERFRTVVDSANDGIIILNSEREIAFWNSAAVQLWGYSEEELLGTPFISLIAPNGETTFLQLASTVDAPCNEHNTIANRVVVEAVNHHQHTVPIEISITPWHLEDALFFTVIVRDISEEQRNRANRLKTEFVSVVSHELRTPLTALLGSLKLVSSGMMGGFSDKAGQLLALAQNNGDRLLSLINDILDISKIESGQLTLHYQNVDLIEIINKAIDENSGYADSHDTKICLRNQINSSIKINVDIDRFLQIMANLLSNAAKYAEQGTDIVVEVTADDRDVKIAVTDYGPEIPESFKEQIFEKFTQLDSSATRKVGGTGLGLNITKQLVDAMDGRIDFQSDAQTGTTFSVSFAKVSSPEIVGIA